MHFACIDLPLANPDRPLKGKVETLGMVVDNVKAAEERYQPYTSQVYTAAASHVRSKYDSAMCMSN